MGQLRDRLYRIVKFKIVVWALLWHKKLHAVLFPERDKKLMVNVGGGLFFRPHWKILDYISPFYSFAKETIDWDINLFEQPAFPFKDGQVDFFYSAHTFEHIPQEHCPKAFAEMYRCLKSGGAVRINVPDYDLMRQAVATGDRSFFKKSRSHLTLEQALLEQIATETLGRIPADQVKTDYDNMSSEEFANLYTGMASREAQLEKGGYHVNWFNAAKLETMLREAGFTSVYRSFPQGSRFAELRGTGGWLARLGIFEIDRMLGLDTSFPSKSVYVEAVK